MNTLKKKIVKSWINTVEKYQTISEESQKWFQSYDAANSDN